MTSGLEDVVKRLSEVDIKLGAQDIKLGAQDNKWGGQDYTNKALEALKANKDEVFKLDARLSGVENKITVAVLVVGVIGLGAAVVIAAFVWAAGEVKLLDKQSKDAQDLIVSLQKDIISKQGQVSLLSTQLSSLQEKLNKLPSYDDVISKATTAISVTTTAANSSIEKLYNNAEEKFAQFYATQQENAEAHINSFTNEKLGAIRKYAQDWYLHAQSQTLQFCYGYTEPVCGDIPHSFPKDTTLAEAANKACNTASHTVPLLLRTEPSADGPVTKYSVTCYAEISK